MTEPRSARLPCVAPNGTLAKAVSLALLYVLVVVARSTATEYFELGMHERVQVSDIVVLARVVDRRYSRVLRIVCCIERVKALEQHGENVSLLAIRAQSTAA